MKFNFIGFRFLFGFFIVGVVFGWGGFVSMQNQVIEFYNEELEESLNYDVQNDDSLQKYLGNGSFLLNANYVPSDLVPIESDFTANNSRKFLLRKEAAKNFADMAWFFWKDHKGDRLFISSAYRSAKFQQSLLKNGCSRNRCAEVGSSEHQLGLAIDLGVVTKNGKYVPLTKTNPYYKWLLEKGADWGFHNTYQKGIEVDGQIEEPWHWRFLGKSLAQSLRDTNQTFSERYLEKNSNYF